MVDAVILAGGRNSRIQTRKALLSVSGRPIVERILVTLRPYVAGVLLVTNEPEPYAHLGMQMTGDLIAGGGPLSGLHAGLTLAGAPRILVAACDMPFLHPALLSHILSEAEAHPEAYAVVPKWSAGIEPLHAVYDRRCLPTVESRLQSGELRISAFLDAIPTHRIELDGWAEQRGVDLKTAFMNINTWPEWEVAQKLAAEGGGAVS